MKEREVRQVVLIFYVCVCLLFAVPLESAVGQVAWRFSYLQCMLVGDGHGRGTEGRSSGCDKIARQEGRDGNEGRKW